MNYCKSVLNYISIYPGDNYRNCINIPSKNRFTVVHSNKKMKRTWKAVLTVEAAVVLPLFMFAVLALIYLFQVMELQLKLQSALNRTAEQTASYGYLLGRVLAVSEGKVEDWLEKSELFSEDGLLSVDDTGEWIIKLLSSSVAEPAFKQIAAHYMDISDPAVLRIVGGWDGVNFHSSCLKDEACCVVVRAKYSVRVPFVPEVISELELCQTAVCRLFCGDRAYIPVDRDEEELEEGVYYMTPSGSVYHVSRECSYLKITVLNTDWTRIESMRNSSGGKYYPCERCVKGAAPAGQVYYTRSGSSYHATHFCSSLTRTVVEVSEEEIVGLPPCSRCGRGE